MTETCGGCDYDGKTLNGVHIKICDGFIAIGGATLATTYLNDEGNWSKSFHDGWFTTRDLGTIDSDILTVLGRGDEIVISGGEKISLSAVEEVIRANFPSLSFAAFSVPDAEWGGALYVAIEVGTNISEEDVAQSITSSLGPISKPKGFLHVSEIPLIGIEKIDRMALIDLVNTERGFK
jgi:O-succinylbenzoic acid--CoA ligase